MKRVLIIEDNALSANLYRGALAQDGFQVSVETDGAAGLAAIARGKPDLVLLDLILPKVDGVEVLRRIRQNPDLAAMPVIITSNSYTSARLDELWNAGATQVLAKASVPPRELVRVVREAIVRLAPP